MTEPHYTVTSRPGRPGWRKTIRIKQFLGPDVSDEGVRKAAGQIAAVLRRQHEYFSPDSPARDVDDEFSDIAEEFEYIAIDLDDAYEVADWTRLGHFNATLGDLYDWADANRVWIGGRYD